MKFHLDSFHPNNFKSLKICPLNFTIRRDIVAESTATISLFCILHININIMGNHSMQAYHMHYNHLSNCQTNHRAK